MYIPRELEPLLLDLFGAQRPQGVILAGIVGSGKTTLVEHLLTALAPRYEIFSFTGDDIVFRSNVSQDSQYIFSEVTSRTNKRALIFVDEVQKSEAIFDAVKIAFDRGKISFIVSGSNPAFLDTVAKKRLQRRAEHITLLPFSIPEILCSAGLLSADLCSIGERAISSPRDLVGDLPQITVTPKLRTIVDDFLQWGGLPLVHLQDDRNVRLREIRKVVERGFEPMVQGAERHSDVIRIELANLHSHEFAYQGIFQNTGIRRRDRINETIDELMNQGYVVSKKPLILEKDRRSYLVVYSYVDPGIVSFLTSQTESIKNRGAAVEGYVHARICSFIQRSPKRKELWYYKPYSISEEKLKFGKGEIDFVIEEAGKFLPIEVKSAESRNSIDTTVIKSFMKQNKINCGVVIYGGVPQWSTEERLLYWPYWMV